VASDLRLPVPFLRLGQPEGSGHRSCFHRGCGTGNGVARRLFRLDGV